MIVKEAINSLILADLISLLNENTHSERDNPDKEAYINHVIYRVYMNKHHRITVLYDSDIPIGYMIIRFNKYLMNEIMVDDIFISKDYQGKSNIKILLEESIPTLLSSGAKRIKWQSYVFDADFWGKYAFGTEIKSYKMFYVNISEENKDIYTKTREEENSK